MVKLDTRSPVGGQIGVLYSALSDNFARVKEQIEQLEEGWICGSSPPGRGTVREGNKEWQ